MALPLRSAVPHHQHPSPTLMTMTGTKGWRQQCGIGARRQLQQTMTAANDNGNDPFHFKCGKIFFSFSFYYIRACSHDPACEEPCYDGGLGCSIPNLLLSRHSLDTQAAWSTFATILCLMHSRLCFNVIKILPVPWLKLYEIPHIPTLLSIGWARKIHVHK